MPSYEELADLGLNQRKIEALLTDDPAYVDAWLAAIRRPPPNIKNAIGWMLAGIKARETPPDPRAIESQKQRQKILNAENWIANVGALFALEDEPLVEAALFDDMGIVRHCRDETLKARLLTTWRNGPHPAVVDADADIDWQAA